MGLLAIAFHAVDAGRAHENGTGAMWIAPELVNVEAPAQVCSQTSSSIERPRDLVFETLPFDADTEPRVLASRSREVVDFEWNPATGELSFTTTAPTGVFRDLSPAWPAEFLSSCEAR